MTLRQKLTKLSTRKWAGSMPYGLENVEVQDENYAKEIHRMAIDRWHNQFSMREIYPLKRFSKE